MKERLDTQFGNHWSTIKKSRLKTNNFTRKIFPFSDKNELQGANEYFEQAAAANLPEFLKALSDVLSHAGNSPVARMAAGLQLKNHLTSKDPNLKQQYQAKWLQFAEDLREYIKKNVSFILDCWKSLINRNFFFAYRSLAHLVRKHFVHRRPHNVSLM
jgi:hypothetical protein